MEGGKDGFLGGVQVEARSGREDHHDVESQKENKKSIKYQVDDEERADLQPLQEEQRFTHWVFQERLLAFTDETRQHPTLLSVNLSWYQYTKIHLYLMKERKYVV